MKNNFDNFDDLMKEKLDGMEFPFNEANWEKASQMINAARPAKKSNSNLLLFSSIIAGGVLLVASIYLFSDKLGDNASKEVAQQAEIKSEQNSNGSNSNELTSNTVVSNSKTSNNTIENSSSTNSNENVSSATNEENVTNSNTNSSNTLEKYSSNSTSEKNVSNSKKSISGSSITNSNNKNSLSTKTSSIKNNSKYTSSSGLPIGAAEGARKKGQTNIDEQNLNTASSDQDKKVGLNTSLEKNNNNSDPEKGNEQLAQNTSTTAAAPDTSNGSNSSFTKKKDYVRTKHHTVFVEAGAINSFGWAVNGVRNGNSIAPFAGINYMYNFDSRSSFVVGLQYNSLSNLSESKASFSVTSYEFGMKNDVTTYQITNLHYAVIPMKYIRRINSSHSIGVGLNANYLVSIQNQIETKKQIENNLTETTVKKDVGYGYDQLSRFNAQFALSYQYQITKKIGFNAEINQNITNVVKDYKFFGTNQKNSKPAALKLSLTYTLFNK